MVTDIITGIKKRKNNNLLRGLTQWFRVLPLQGKSHWFKSNNPYKKINKIIKTILYGIRISTGMYL